MAELVSIDPVTRLEGHLRIDVEVEGGVVKDAWSSGTMFRGFEMLLKGFAEETHTFLTPTEKKNMVFAGKLITFEQMIRFGADHLAGDIYYKIHRDGHNLDRCRTQMKMVQSIIAQEDAMNDLAESVFEELS